MKCGCCDDPVAKVDPTPHTVISKEHPHGRVEPVAYCKEHWVWCRHNGSFGPNGEDWEGDEPECLAYLASLEAEWEALPNG